MGVEEQEMEEAHSWIYKQCAEWAEWMIDNTLLDPKVRFKRFPAAHVETFSAWFIAPFRYSLSLSLSPTVLLLC